MPISISVKTGSRVEMLDITSYVQKEISNSGVKDGVCTLYVPHTTAGITINEGADPSVCHDILTKLNKLVPTNAGYQHMEGYKFDREWGHENATLNPPLTNDGLRNLHMAGFLDKSGPTLRSGYLRLPPNVSER